MIVHGYFKLGNTLQPKICVISERELNVLQLFFYFVQPNGNFWTFQTSELNCSEQTSFIVISASIQASIAITSNRFCRVRIVKNELGEAVTQQELRGWGGVGGHNGNEKRELGVTPLHRP